ncbi:HD-GYP domain-containing protein [Aminivibrio sp.]|jgi:putative nucleotidyltransferase with HDIG domain|uniref:HD-GYP domain-containing protein n=1 Tax=Aminivibrio sp. TaxID=1872489 RepID=UPI001A5609BB|nr:HD-GYP domain-containing protein [Aminivibrio sp.]MBL3539884.1 HD-GYP domain-containing protein [Aminivibrio sp.]
MDYRSSEATRSAARETAEEKVVYVPLDDLARYRGKVAEDIISEEGALLLPRGSDVPVMLKTMPGITKTLRQWNKEFIPVQVSSGITEEEFEATLRAIEPKTRMLDPSLAMRAIDQVEEVYSRISEDGVSREGIETLEKEADRLARDVMLSPQILLCLGKVKDSDEYTFIHSLNVALLSGYLASVIHPGDEELVKTVTFGGLLHDLGKAKVPREILNKPGRLTTQEFDIMKTHPIHGMVAAVASGVSDRRILSVVRNHHERWGGDGYPDGLRENRISLHARIAAVADVFDALTAKRVYKDPMRSREAVSMILESSGSSFDGAIVRALLVSVGLYPVGTVVELSDYSVGVVTGVRNKDLLRPQVFLSVDPRGRRPEAPTIIDLSLGTDLFIRRSLDDMGKGVVYGRDES